MPTLAYYAGLITSQHANKPKFIASVAASMQPLIDIQGALGALPPAFDLDEAIGAQLDIVGLWVGIGRRVAIPLTDVYFAWDTAGLGWDQGAWMGPFDSPDGLVSLDDDSYRTLIRTKIAANSATGTIPNAQAVLDLIMTGKPGLLYIEDHQDMSVLIGLAGDLPDAITQALISPNYIKVTATTVKAQFVKTSVSGTPCFGFDVENEYVSGWDTGSWAIPTS